MNSRATALSKTNRSLFAKPGSNRARLLQRCLQRGDGGIADCLLLSPQVVAEKSIARDVAGIHTRQGMVHQEVHVDFVDASRLPDRAVRLAQVVAPLRQLGAIL